MQQYIDLVKDILENGVSRGDRTGTGTIAVFGRQLRFDLSNDKFPLLTTKKVHLRSIVEELLFFIGGHTNNNILKEKNVSIWDGWALKEDFTVSTPYTPFERVCLLAEKKSITNAEAILLLNAADREKVGGGLELLEKEDIPTHYEKVRYKKGELGPIYGKQWRQWENPDGTTVDQIADLIKNLKEKPFSRRHVVTAWNPSVLPNESISPQENVKIGNQALPSCHNMFQFFVSPISNEGRAKIAHQCSQSSVDQVPKLALSCNANIRSSDIALGYPFNLASYALLTKMIARVCGMYPLELVITTGDTHIYNNHITALKEQITRVPRKSPKLYIESGIKDIDDFRAEDFILAEYDPYPSIKMDVSI